MTTALNRYPNMCGWWHDTAKVTYRLCMRADGHNGAHLAEDGSRFFLGSGFDRQGLACEELPPRSPGVPYRGPRLPCVGRPGHSGEHADASGRTWANDHADTSTGDPADASTGVPASTDASTGTNTEGSLMSNTGDPATGTNIERSIADVLVLRLQALFAMPGTLARAIGRLNDADDTFGRLDHALRRGAPLPTWWLASAHTIGNDQEREQADELYDTLSEALRTAGRAHTCLRALKEAAYAWRALDDHLLNGGVLPSPWAR